MIAITTDERGISFQKSDGVFSRHAYDSMRFQITGDTVDFVYGKNLICSERLGAILVNGEALTADTVNSRLCEALFSTPDGAGGPYAPLAELNKHIEGDALRWQQIGDSAAAMYAEMVKIAGAVYSGIMPNMDTDNPKVVYGGNGLLTLSAGGEWTAHLNGFIVVVYQAIVGVAPVLLKNGNAVDYGGLSILGSGTPSAPIQINAGDVITATGNLGLGASFNVTFYPNKL